ncbi:MAG: fibronectin type protein [Acidimicrobiales bacterium]|nr:fibronectin type protein [Acidimicrobiales bacterium]
MRGATRCRATWISGAVALATLVGGLAVAVPPAGADGRVAAWAHQLGSSADDTATASITDAAATTYLVGRTAGTLPGSVESNSGGDDAFVAAYDAGGNKLWVHQLGSAANDGATAVSLDGSGSVLVAGTTAGTLPGSPTANLGNTDAFVAKFAADGTVAWVRQVGSTSADSGAGVGADGSGDVFVAGLAGAVTGAVGTGNGLVAKFDGSGSRQWASRFAAGDVHGFAVDGTGRSYATGVVVGEPRSTYSLSVGPTGAVGAPDVHHTYCEWFPIDPGGTVIDDGYTVCHNFYDQGVVVDAAGNGYVVRGDEVINDAGPYDYQVIAHAFGPLTRPDRHLSAGYVSSRGTTAMAGDGTMYLTGSDGSYSEAPGDKPLGGIDATMGVTTSAGGGWYGRVGSAADDSVAGGGQDGTDGAVVVGSTAGTLPGALECNAGGDDIFITRSDPGAPISPEGLVVSKGDGLLRIAFDEWDRGGSPITGYTASCESPDGGGPATATGAASPLTVALTNGFTYHCTVAATNAQGTSSPSAPTPDIRVGAPDAPNNVISRGGSSGAATVTWTEPASYGSAITDHQISCTSSDGGVPQTTTSPTSPATVTGLTDGDHYSCTVTATNARGSGPASWYANSFEVGQAPGAPTIGTMTWAAGNRPTAVVSFTPGAAGSEATFAYFAECDSSDGGTGQRRWATTSPITVTGLSAGNTYTCRVQAANAVGLGAWSADSNAALFRGRPLGQSIPYVSSSGDHRLTFTLQSPGNLTPSFAANGRPILHTDASCTSPDGGAPATAAATGAPSQLAVTGLSNFHSYRCVFTATNAIGKSDPLTASGEPGTLPRPPVSVQAAPVAGSTNVSVSWSLADPVVRDKYRVMEVIPSRNGVAQASTVTTDLHSAVVSGLTLGQTYTFRVVAYGRGASAPSAPSAPIAIGAPSPPRQLVVSTGSGSATVSWKAPASVGSSALTAYTVTPYDGTAALASHTVSQSAQTLTIPGLTNGVGYRFQVVAKNSYGKSQPVQNIGVIKPGSAHVPGAPSGITPVLSATKATLTWTAPASEGTASVASYRITPYKDGVAQPSTTSTIPSLAYAYVVDHTYKFAISAVNAAGVGPATQSISFIAGTPSAPLLVDAFSRPGGAHLDWLTNGNSGAGITGYVITPYLNGVAQAQINVSGGATYYLGSGYTTGSSYRFTVALRNSRGVGPPSAQSAAVVPT